MWNVMNSFVMNFIIFILSKFRIELLAAIVWGRIKFYTEKIIGDKKCICPCQ
jgi:hypothetical protein